MKGRAQGVPGEGCTLDAKRKVSHCGKEGQLFSGGGRQAFHARGFLLGQELMKGLEGLVGYLQGRLLDEGGHDRGRGFAYSAALAFKAYIFDVVARDLQRKVNVIATQGVVPFCLVCGVFQTPVVARIVVMLQENILVQALQVATHARKLSKNPIRRGGGVGAHAGGAGDKGRPPASVHRTS